MVSAIIVFDTMNDVTHFVNKASKQPYDIDIVKDKTELDGKSFEGIITVGLSQDLKCVLHTDVDNAKEFIDSIKPLCKSNFTECVKH